MQNKFNVLIIGAGKIGAFFDSPMSPETLTHAHAFSKHRGFNLIGFYDLDYKKAQRAAKLWKVKSFRSLADTFTENRIDIISVAVPDNSHYQVLKEIIQYHPKFVFAEKPLTTLFSSSRKIVNLFQKNKIPLLVNYSRRFVPEFIELKKEIDRKTYGKFLGGIGYYGKGILHNGSHLINLLKYYLGKIQIIDVIKSEKDFYDKDPSTTVILKINSDQRFFLQHINCQNYSIFEIDLLFEKGRLRIVDSGFVIEKYNVKESPSFKGYYSLVGRKIVKTSFNQALYHAVNHIFNVLNNKDKLLCPAEEASEDVKLCLTISKKAINA